MLSLTNLKVCLRNVYKLVGIYKVMNVGPQIHLARDVGVAACYEMAAHPIPWDVDLSPDLEQGLTHKTYGSSRFFHSLQNPKAS
jgi:hypothetical protein